jgi:hypothetical protein
MMFSAFQTFGKLGALASSVARAWSPTTLFAAGEAGGLWDFSTLANLYQDSAGTTPCTAVGQPIGKVLDTSGRGNHLTQATSTKRPTLGRMPATGVRNLLVNTATLSTQNVTTVAGSYTIQFTGAGSVTASGTYSGTLTNGQTFTCTAGTLTLTVSGSVTAAQLEAGSTATAKQVVGAAYDITESGVASVYTAYFDGVDDCLVSPSIDFSGTDKMTVFEGSRPATYTAQGILVEVGSNYDSLYPSFFVRGAHTTSNYLFAAFHGSTGYYSGPALPANMGDVAHIRSLAFDASALTVSGKFPISRVNGVEYAESDLSADPAGTTFVSAPVYIGQRNQAQQPYKGFIQGISIRGATTDADTIVKMEKWLAARTPGVNLP